MKNGQDLKKKNTGNLRPMWGLWVPTPHKVKKKKTCNF